MRVLLVAGSYPPDHCGVGDYTEKLATALTKVHGLHVGVLTTVLPGRVRSHQVELVEAAKNWSFSELLKLIRAVRQWKPDFVHIQYPSQGFFFRRLPSFLPLIYKLIGIRVILTWHEPHRQRGVLHFVIQALGAHGLIFVRPNYLAMLPASFRSLIKFIPQATIPNANALPVSSLEKYQRLKLRDRYLHSRNRLVVFFGFVYQGKGIESLFDIATSSSDSLVIAGAIKDNAYAQQLAELARLKGWSDDQINFTGFLSPPDAADLLAVADAVVLPFVGGGGEWNTSIHSALAQGTLVITTAVPPSGYEALRNLFTAAPSDINAMRTALDQLAGHRVAPLSSDAQWQGIASAHVAFYHRCS